MRQRLRPHGAFGLMAAGLALFLAALVLLVNYGNRVTPVSMPSSFNSLPSGSRALYLLYQKLGLPTERLESDWYALDSSDSLLVVIDPFDQSREPDASELNALKQWIQKGGTLLFIPGLPARTFDTEDPLLGDIAVVAASAAPSETAPAPVSSIASGVSILSVRSPVRIQVLPGAPYKIFLRDGQGIVGVEKRVGKGAVYAIANADLLSNQGIANADNAVLLANLASTALAERPGKILFDEYHHGIGFKASAHAPGLWAAVPHPLKLALFYLAAAGLLVLYTNSLRFGPALGLAVNAYHPTADYLRAVARLQQRAGGGAVALEILGAHFRSRLASSSGLPLETHTETLLARAALLYHLDSESKLALGKLLSQCAPSADIRLSDKELLETTRTLETWMRRLKLDGYE